MLQDLAKEAGIGYDVFMRTTEERHKVAVEHVWVSAGCEKQRRELMRDAEGAECARIHLQVFVRRLVRCFGRGVLFARPGSGGHQRSDGGEDDGALASGSFFLGSTHAILQVSIETGTQVEWMEEENYKFRLSSFREPLLAWLSTTPHGPTFLLPLDFC